MKILFVAMLSILVCGAQAQKNTNTLKINGGAEITTGVFADGYNTGWGAYLTDYYSIGPQSSVLLSTGLASWSAKDYEDFKIGMFLTRVGLRHFIPRKFYLQTDLGIAVGLKEWKGTNRAALGIGPGYLFRTKNGSGIDLSARVNGSFNRTWFGLALGYEFKL
jgi:hypothetical protein